MVRRRFFRKKKGGTDVGNFFRKFKPKKIPSPIKKGGGIPAPSKPFRGFNPPTPSLGSINKNRGKVNLRPPASRSGGSSRGRSRGGSIPAPSKPFRGFNPPTPKLKDLNNSLNISKREKNLLASFKKSGGIRSRNIRNVLNPGLSFINDAKRKEKIFLENNLRNLQNSVNSGKLSVNQANIELNNNLKNFNTKINKELLKNVRNVDKSEVKKFNFNQKGTVTIGRKLTDVEKASILKSTNLTINQLDNSVAVKRNGVLMIESPTINFKLKIPKIKPGQKITPSGDIFKDGKGRISRVQFKFNTWIDKQLKEIGNKKEDARVGLILSKKVKPVGIISQKFIRKNPKLTLLILKNGKITKKSWENLRKTGLLTASGISGVLGNTSKAFIDISKFLTVNNPLRNKESRKQASKDIKNVWKFTKKNVPLALRIVKDTVVNKDKRNTVLTAGGILLVDGITAVKTDPTKWISKAGSEIVSWALLDGELRLAGKIIKSTIKYPVKIGSKIIKTESALDGFIIKNGRKIKEIEIKGKKIIGKFKKTLEKKITKRLIKRKIKKEIGKAIKKTKRKLTTIEKKNIRKKVRDSFKKKKFTKFEKSLLKDSIDRIESKINGVKVTKKEFRSYQRGIKEIEKIKKIDKLTGGIIKTDGSGKTIKKITKKVLDKKGKDLLNVVSKIPTKLLKKVHSVSVTTISQKFFRNVHSLKRFGGVKNGIWKIVTEKKPFYMNSVSIGLFNVAGESVGNIAFNSISVRAIKKFHSISNAIKFGRGKSISFSRGIGKNFVETFSFKKKGKRFLKSEFISKIKITNEFGRKRFISTTKKVSKIGRKRSLRKRFRNGKEKLTSVGRISKNGDITIKSIINTAKVETSKIEQIVKVLNNFKNKSLKRASINRINKLENIAKKSGLTKIEKVKIRRKINDIKKSQKIYIGTSEEIIKAKRIDRKLKEVRRLKEIIKAKLEGGLKKQAKKELKKLKIKVVNTLKSKNIKTLREVERDLIREIKDAGKIIRKKTSKIKKFTKEEMKQLSKSNKRFKKKLKNVPRKFRNKIKQERINRRKIERKNRNILNNIRKRKPLTQKQAREKVRLRNIEIAKNTPKMSKFKQKKVNEVFKSLQKNKEFRELIGGSQFTPKIRSRIKIDNMKEIQKIFKAEKRLKAIARLKTLSKAEKILLKNLSKMLFVLIKAQQMVSKSKNKKALKNAFKQVLIKKTKLKNKLIVEKQLKTIRKIIPIITPIIPEIPKIIIPIIPPPIIIKEPKIIKFQRKNKKFKSGQRNINFGYNVFIKTRGKVKKFNKIPLSKISAKNRLAYILDNSTAVTGSIRKVGKVKKIGKITSKEYGARKRIKARKYKIVKGRRVSLKNKIIERKGRPRINTRGEKRGLSASKILKRIRKKPIRRRKRVKKKK